MPESSPQSDSESPQKGWFHTLPGMLTAIAALITAVTGLIVALPPKKHDLSRPEVQATAENEGKIDSVATWLEAFRKRCTRDGSFLSLSTANTGYVVQFVPDSTSLLLDIPMATEQQRAPEQAVRQTLRQLRFPFSKNNDISLQATLAGPANSVAAAVAMILEKGFGVQDTVTLLKSENCPTNHQP